MPCTSPPWNHDIDCPKGGCVCGRYPDLYLKSNVKDLKLEDLEKAVKVKKDLLARGKVLEEARSRELSRQKKSKIDQYVADALRITQKVLPGEKLTVVLAEINRSEVQHWDAGELGEKLRAWLNSCKHLPSKMTWTLHPGNVLYSWHSH